jgi:hypothetical protein
VDIGETEGVADGVAVTVADGVSVIGSRTMMVPRISA